MYTLDTYLSVLFVYVYTINDVYSTQDKHIWGVIVPPQHLLLGVSIIHYIVTHSNGFHHFFIFVCENGFRYMTVSPGLVVSIASLPCSSHFKELPCHLHTNEIFLPPVVTEHLVSFMRRLSSGRDILEPPMPTVFSVYLTQILA